MAQSKRDSRISNRTQRQKLAARSDPYWTSLEPRRFLGYRKGRKGAGTWVAKLYAPEASPRTQQQVIGIADDLVDGNGAEIMSYAQAQSAAREWFEERLRLITLQVSGEIRQVGPYTVADAMADYLRDAEIRGMKSLAEAKITTRAHILPELGNVQVSKLVRGLIQRWLLGLAERARRKTGRRREIAAFLDTPRNEDERRARRSTANRILSTLKAALNHAYMEGKVTGMTPWREVRPFQAVTSARTRFLNPAEQRRLINACPPDFKRLVRAALHTGCRYGELIRLRMGDFDSERRQVYVAPGKTNKPRWVTLSVEGWEWFKAVTAGQSHGAVLLTRDSVVRTSRDGSLGSLSWAPHDQKPFMDRACVDSGLERLTFHELRHTFASGLVNGGMPLLQVAAQLGHSDTRMVERHYGHLCPNAMKESMERYAPILGLETQTVEDLAIRIADHAGDAPETVRSASYA